MEQTYVLVKYDRRNRAKKTGLGKIEFLVYLGNKNYKYIPWKEVSPEEWEIYKESMELSKEHDRLEEKLRAMSALGLPITKENVEQVLEIVPEKRPVLPKSNNQLSNTLTPAESTPIISHTPARVTGDSYSIHAKESFLDFFHDMMMSEEGIKESTRKHRITVYKSLTEDYKRIQTFGDLTPENIRAYDSWLHMPYIDKRRDIGSDGKRIKRKKDSKPKMSVRSDSGVYEYHKTLRPYVKAAFMQGYISENPYDRCSFSKGKAKPRKPLTEQELVKVREFELEGHLAKARDIFIFCAYTGLAYRDAMEFDFSTMTDHIGDMYYIDGKRVKTGSDFYTPILKPAMEVLMRHRMTVPYMSNQKLNDYLHIIQHSLGLHKTMTSHVGRHSFATLNITKNVRTERLQKMLGHKHLETTEIYTHLASTVVTEVAPDLNANLL